MHVNLIIALVSGITFVAYFIVAWRLRNSFTSVEDYFNYSRQMPENLFSDTFLATNVTFASIYLVITATTFERGNLTLWILIAWIVGLLLFRKLFPRATNFLEKGHTLHEFLGNTYQSDMLRKLASICTIIVFTGTLGIEFWGVMMILNGLGLTNSLTRGFVAIFIALVTSLYTMLGGFKAAVHTDHLQKYLILIMGFLLALLSFGAFGSLAGFSGAQRINILNDLFNLKNLFSDPLFSISIFIMFVPFNFCVMDMWQRCTATTKLVRNSAIKSVGSLKTMLTFAFAFGVPIIVGLAARQVSPKLSPASGMSILPNFISSLSVESALQIGVNALIYAGFFAALASTADTLLINISYTFVYDILAPCRNIDFSTITAKQKEHTIAIFKFWVFFFGLLAVPLIFCGLTLYQLVFAVFSSQIVLFIPILYGLLKPEYAAGRANGAMISVIAGFAIAILSVVIGFFFENTDLINATPILAFGVSTMIFFIIPKSNRNYNLIQGNLTEGEL